MQKLNKLKITDAIKKNISQNGGKILGICLGMQLLASLGTEDKKMFDCEIEVAKKLRYWER